MSEFFDAQRAPTLQLPLKSHIEQFIASNTPQVLQEASLRKWGTLCSSFQKRQSVEPLFSPESFPEDLCQECFNFVLAAGFGVVVAVDGLDLLDFIPEAEERYNNLLDGCEQLNASHEKVAATYVFVVRNTSTTMLNRLLTQSPFQKCAPAMYEVCLPSLDSIVAARLSYLRQAVPAQLPQLTGSLAGPEQTKEYWWRHLEGFREYLDTRIGAQLDGLNLFGANLRCAMQVIQTKYHLYLDEAVRHSYLLTEVLTTRGKSIPTQPYSYKIVGNQLERSLASSTLYDSHFLPSLFAPPVVILDATIEDNLCDALSPAKHLLVSLRILQLLDAQTKGATPDVSDVCVQVLVSFLEKYFSYSPMIVVAAIEELVLYECAIFVDAERVRTGDTIARRVALTPKGRTLYRDYLFDLSYLALAGMLVPIADAASENSFFTACTPFDSDKTTLWISVKLRNSLSLLRLIEFVNRREADAVANRLAASPAADGYKALAERASHAFQFALNAGSLRNSVVSSCEKIIGSLQDESGQPGPRARPVLDSLKRYFSAWC